MRPTFHCFCNPGIQITTDAWKGYNFLRPEGWRHMMVVHKRYDQLPKHGGMCMFVFLRNFVCPLTGAHTNGVERTWRPMKRYFSFCFFDERRRMTVSFENVPKRKTSYFVQFRFLSLFMVIPVQSWAERNARWSNLRRNRQMFSVVMGWITRQVIPNTLSVITHSIHVVYTHSKLHYVFKYDKFIKYTQYTTCNPKIWKKNTPYNFCKIHGVNNTLFTPCNFLQKNYTV